MTTTQGSEVTKIQSPAGHTYFVIAEYRGDYSGVVAVAPSSYVVQNEAGEVQWTYQPGYRVRDEIRKDIERGKWDPAPEAAAVPEAPVTPGAPDPQPIPFVAPLGWVQDVFVPVAHTEGAVVLDLSAFLPDVIREIRRHGFDTDVQVLEALQRKGYATPHLSLGAADALAEDLIRAHNAAEEAATITETTARKGD